MYPTFQDPGPGQVFTIDEAACAWVGWSLPLLWPGFIHALYGSDDPDKQFADHVKHLPNH